MIKIHANENALKSYILIDEMIYEFKNMFNIFNKIIKDYVDLYDFKFEMKLNDKNEFFKTFYVHFNTIIALLKFIEIFKIFNFIRLILTRL